jgi:hypothetical protein
MHWGHDMTIIEYAQALLDETDTADIASINEWFCMNGCDVHMVGSNHTKHAPLNGVEVIVYDMDDADDDRLSTMQDPIDIVVITQQTS